MFAKHIRRTMAILFALPVLFALMTVLIRTASSAAGNESIPGTLAPPTITIAITAPVAAGPYEDPASITIQATVASPGGGSITKVEFFEGNRSVGTDVQTPFVFNWNNIGAGNYNVTAMATNDRGETTRSNVINFSVFSKPHVSLSTPETGEVFATGSLITLAANAFDKDGSIAKVDFMDGVNLLNTSSGPAFTYQWLGATSGSHTLTAVATDNDGNTRTSATVIITVSVPATVAITATDSKGSSVQPFAKEELVTVTATGTAAAGASPVANIGLYEREQLLALAPGASVSFNVVRTSTCDRRFKAVATDATGMKTENDITVSFQTVSGSLLSVPNGINVGQTKLFDQRSLALMLQSMQSNLANRDFYNQASIAAAIGTVQGARLDTSSLSANVTTTPIPGVTTTTNSATPSIAETVTQASTPVGSPTPSAAVNTVTTTPSSTTQQVTTQPSVTSTPPTLPTQNTSFAFQPTFDLAPQTLLASQMSMNYEIANLRLLLEGALSDRLIDQPINVGGSIIPVTASRARAIAGFRISLDSPRIYKKAVAEVEITVKSTCNLPSNMQHAPSLVTLVPMENNYNVATVSKNAKQFGLGVAIQPISFGIASQKTKEQLYLIQDQDTVAFERDRSANADPLSVTFGWQFRPVLGQEVVKAGARQVYASLALPVSENEKFEGEIEVHTYWRSYDLKKKTVGDIIAGSESFSRLQNLVVNSDFIRGVALQPQIARVDYQDAGDGQVLVWVRGSNFLPGTQVIVGDQILDRAEKGLFIQSENDLRFIVAAQQLAFSDEPRIIGRFGSPIQICNDEFRSDNGNCEPKAFHMSEAAFGLKIKNVEIVPVDAQNARVSILVSSEHNTLPRSNLRPIVLMGKMAYGIGGSPLEITERDRSLELSFTAPLQSIRAAGKLRVKAPFLVRNFSTEATITGGAILPDDFTATGVTILSSSDTSADLAIAGTNFSPDVTVTVAEKDVRVSAAIAPLSLNRFDATLLILHIAADDLKKLKHLVVRQGQAQPVIISITTPPPGIPKIKVSSMDTVLVNDENDIKVQGINLTAVDKVMFRGVILVFEPSKDGASGTLRVTKDISETPGTKSVDFISKDGSKITGSLVVNSRAGSK